MLLRECFERIGLQNICLVVVTKDKTHKAKEIIRSINFKTTYADAQDAIFDDGDIISINQEVIGLLLLHTGRRSLSRGLTFIINRYYVLCQPSLKVFIGCGCAKFGEGPVDLTLGWP